MTTPSAPTGDHGGLRELSEAATPGRWFTATTGVRGGDHWYVCAGGEAVAWISANDGTNEEQREPDAAFIVAAVNHVRSLLAAHPEPEPAQDGEVGE